MTLPSPMSSSSTMAASSISILPSRSLACFQRSAQTASCTASLAAAERLSAVVPRMKSTLWVLTASLCSRITRATPGSVTIRPAVVALTARISIACCICAVVTVTFAAVALASKVAVRALSSRIRAAFAVTSF